MGDPVENTAGLMDAMENAVRRRGNRLPDGASVVADPNGQVRIVGADGSLLPAPNPPPQPRPIPQPQPVPRRTPTAYPEEEAVTAARQEALREQIAQAEDPYARFNRLSPVIPADGLPMSEGRLADLARETAADQLARMESARNSAARVAEGSPQQARAARIRNGNNGLFASPQGIYGDESFATDADLRGVAEVYPIFDTPEAKPAPAVPDTTSFGERALLGAPKGPQMYDLEADTRALVKGIPMVGAQRVGLDPLQVEGANQMGAALAQLDQQYEALGKRASAGEERYMQEYDKYRTGLGELAQKGEAMRGARAVERQIETQQTAAAQMAFDANRVFQDLSQSPVQTGALALAAGIMQGLQGYAGQDKPNAIIAAVQDAAQRDVANQMEQYKRMQAGQQAARNNFTEARQALQDDQQALQVTAMATLDQISKGLDFIKARTLRAKDRADIEQAQGKIKIELGDARVKLATDYANRALTAAMANQREASDIAQKMINARENFNKMTEEQKQRAIVRVADFLKSEDGQAMTLGISNVKNFYEELAKMKKGGASDKEMFKALSQDFLGDLTNNLRIAANNVKGQDGNALGRAFEGLAAETIANASISEEERKLRGMVANSFQAYLRQTLGKSQTSPELVNARLVVNLKDPQSVLTFMNKIIENSQVFYQQEARVDPAAAPKWYEAYGSLIDMANSSYNSIGAPVRESAKLFAK